MKYLSIIGVIIFLFLVSCKSDETARDVLLSFINYRFQDGQTRDKLISKSHGKMKRLLIDMRQQEFKKFAQVNKLEKKKFKILLENCRVDICFITYTLRYTDYETDKKDKEKYKIEVKKIAKLEKINESWLISDINNIKTYIDSKLKMDITNNKNSDVL